VTSAVFDCMIFVQTILNRRGPAAACLKLCEESHVRLFLSPNILAEIRDVLGRPTFRGRFRQITDERVAELLDRVGGWATHVEKVPIITSLARDPKDEPYLNLALFTNASFLVTRDRDLLSLMQDSSFVQNYPGLNISEPREFLRHIRTEIAKGLGYE